MKVINKHGFFGTLVFCNLNKNTVAPGSCVPGRKSINRVIGNLAKVTIYLTDESLLPGFMEAAAGALPSPPPATTLLIVKALAGPSLLVEIEGVAVA